MYGFEVLDTYIDSRIDAQHYITGLDQRQYCDEIYWAYCLGYLTREKYYQLLEYLDTIMMEKEKAENHLYQVHMEQIAYEQAILADKEHYRESVRELFLRHVRYDNSQKIYYYHGWG